MEFENILGVKVNLGTSSAYVEKVINVSENLKTHFKEIFEEFGIPRFAIILGTSGPKKIIEKLKIKKIVSYSELGFPVSKAKGHAPEKDGPESKAYYGLLAGVPVFICVGRVHYFECKDMDRTTLMVRSICLLGIKDFIITNASGALFRNSNFSPGYNRSSCYSAGVGSILPVTDFVNMMGDNPLAGEEDYFHTFTDPNKVLIRKYIKRIKQNPPKKIYIAVSGRNFETKAEAEMFALYGDLMGMSSVPEILAIAQQEGRALLLSLVTNLVASDYFVDEEITHEGNLDVVKEKDEEFSKIILDFVASFKYIV